VLKSIATEKERRIKIIKARQKEVVWLLRTQ
jgi:hypothetical protein